MSSDDEHSVAEAPLTPNAYFASSERTSKFEKQYPSLTGKIKRSSKTGYYELVWVRHVAECTIDKDVLKSAMLKIMVEQIREHPGHEAVLRQYVGLLKRDLKLEARDE